MWASRRHEAGVRSADLYRQAEAARADARGTRQVADAAATDAESRASLQRSAARMDDAAAQLERTAERYLAMYRGEDQAQDGDEDAWC